MYELDILLKIFLFSTGGLVFTLDSIILYQIANSLSIARVYLSFSLSISIPAILILEGVYLFLLGYSFSNKTFISESNVLLKLPVEYLMYNLVSCFNFTSHFFIKSRLVIQVLFVTLFSMSMLLNSLRNSKINKRKILKKINFLITILTSIVIFLISMMTIWNLKPVLKSPIGPYNIDMGLFSQNEIESIKNGNFAKNDLSKYQILPKLSDILYSNDKVLAYQFCDYSCNKKKQCHKTCVNYYWHFLYFRIDCNRESSRIFTDCTENATNLRIVLKYLDEGAYPIYNCAVENGKNCSLGCPNLVQNYQLYLVQENFDKIEPAWTGLCNCFKKHPNIMLKQEIKLNACSSNSLELVETISKFFYFFRIISYIFT